MRRGGRAFGRACALGRGRLGTTVGNWGASWSLRTLDSWSNWLVLASLAAAIGQYALCVLVTPGVEDAADLAAFHLRQHRRYAIAYPVLIVFAICQNLKFAWGGAYSEWLRDTLFCLLMAVATSLVILVPARWAQWSGALVNAAAALYLMVAATNILTR